MRFRRAPIAQRLDRLAFNAVTAQLKSKAVTVKAGTLVDATIIASASETARNLRRTLNILNA